MNRQQFESQSRDLLEQVLNRLQSATLLNAQLELQLAETGSELRMLSQLIETFVSHQPSDPTTDPNPPESPESP